ncbi:NAD-dependent epimerase/dehydratase family protein [Feifania hominis]|uniref:NAD-dependent epimerase/dehydratase family protein n=1 Tax=Feifania hominis TaxID=2763660 RepID=A0A926HR35_9FIRM|nr:NAD-dependent epimerase/dehydratase family protein [Feifania hominis]MBC8537002.1 NAD-dependent epimerase/dehydratase family protein [Feifania hominis]
MLTELGFDRENDLFLVTGAAGFIGSNLMEAIAEEGFRVRGLDDYSLGKKETVSRLQKEYSIEFVSGSVADFEVCKRACKGVSYVLHQAAWGSVPRSLAQPLDYDRMNITGTLNMMQAAREQGVRRFVYASSSAVYGDIEASTMVEGLEGNAPSPYALTKQVDELYARLYSTVYGLECVGLRYFNVYGKNQDPHGAYAAVIPIFIKALLENREPTIFGDGSATRDYIHVSDVVRANLLAAKAPAAAVGEAFNIGSGRETSLNRLFSIIRDTLCIEIEPIYEPERPGDVPHSVASVSKARDVLGFESEVELREGIKKTIEWYRNNL